MVTLATSYRVATKLTSDIVLEGLSISNLHLQMYSSIYESSDDVRSEFVYAEDLSLNGIFWRSLDGRESRVNRGTAVLLSDGDRIRLCNDLCFVFRSASGIGWSVKCFNPEQEKETKVRCDPRRSRSVFDLFGAGLQ